MDNNLNHGITEEEQGKLASQLLVDWYLNAVQALVDTAGSEEASKLLWPYFRNAENAAFLIIVKAFGLDQKNRITLGFISGVTFNFISRAPILRSRIFQRGAIATLSGCPFENGPDVNCAVFCEKGSLTYEEAIGVPYHSTIVSCAARGDQECKFVMKPADCENPRDESDLGMEIANILNWQLPKEMVDSFSVQYLAEFWILATKALIDHLGEESVATMLAPYMKHRGVFFGLKGSSVPSHGVFDLMRISSRIDLCEEALNMESLHAESDVNMVERTIVDCPFREAPVAVCLQFEAFCNGICEAIGPDYQFTYDRMMTKGDKTCHWTIRKKKEAGKGLINEVGTPDDPAKMLAMRFAKGEITEEEFRKKMAVLKEFRT
jgi:hypothetical protein